VLATVRNNVCMRSARRGFPARAGDDVDGLRAFLPEIQRRADQRVAILEVQ